ncbi:hypothetical protein ACS0TY_033364 [Phlomoides rotata]
MSQDAAPEADGSDIEPDFVEVDPSGRYGRYKEVLGKGAFKKVYPFLILCPCSFLFSGIFMHLK